jgi:hypothetical protein
MKSLPCLILLCTIYVQGFSQEISKDSIQRSFAQINGETIKKLQTSYSNIDESVNRHTILLLERLQNREVKLKIILQKKDSSRALQLFSNSETTFQMLRSKLQEPLSTNPVSLIKNYIPGIDSIKTAMQFLNKSGSFISNQKEVALLGQINQLQTTFQNANSIKEYLSQREANLQDQLSQFGLSKQLTTMSKQLFYYQQELSQYKEILNDRQKQQEIILSAVRDVPAFNNFWQKNSFISQLFPLPGNSGTVLAGVGLQTNAQIGKNIQQRLGANLDDGGTNASQFLQQKVNNGQNQMDLLKNKLDKLGMVGGSSDMVLPDFTPEYPNKKSVFKRLELGFNIQNNNGTNFLPTISNLGLSLGYKINKNTTVGFGISYLLGLGTGINHIHLSNQGIGIQNFVNIKLKGSIWLAGGFEYNYMKQFESISVIKNINLWQKSALLGLMKKYSVGKKSGNIQLLYDFLAARQIPQSQPLKIRFGFNLN